MEKSAVEFLFNIYSEQHDMLYREDFEEAEEMEKQQNIKSKIEAVNHFCKLNGFADSNMHKSVIAMYEQQLKK
jgi:hypothetical protein